MAEPSEQSIRAALDQAWRDHHHVRDQTWRVLHMVALLAAAQLVVDVGFAPSFLSVAMGLLTLVGAACGVAITLKHRNGVEVLKFTQIDGFQKALGLHELLGPVSVPVTLELREVLDLRTHNTPLFLMRMHLLLGLFAVLLMVHR